MSTAGSRWSSPTLEGVVVCWSDSVWYGSPQWQIEALRRLEIPPDMQKKTASCPQASLGAIATDTIAAIKAE
jgi:uncharacterized protein